MKEFEVNIIQKLEGNYKGKTVIEAKNKEDLKIKLPNLTEDEIDDLVHS